MALGPIITEAQIAGWEARRVETRSLIHRLHEQESALTSLIDAGRAVLGLDAPTEPPVERTVAPKVAPQPPAKRHPRKRHAKPKSWSVLMMDVVNSAAGPLTYQELRAQMQTISAKEREWSDKSFYGTMNKLADSKTLVRYKGRVFSVAAFEKFEMDVLNGTVADFEESGPSRQPSALGKFFIGRIAGQPIGLTSGELIAAARQHPEFAETVGKNKSFPYNVLKSLVEKKEIQKSEDGRYFPIFNEPNNGPMVEAPHYIKDLARKLPDNFLDKFTGGITDEH